MPVGIFEVVNNGNAVANHHAVCGFNDRYSTQTTCLWQDFVFEMLRMCLSFAVANAVFYQIAANSACGERNG